MNEREKKEELNFNDISRVSDLPIENYSPVGEEITFIEYLELLLKKPGKLFYEINNNPKPSHFFVLLFFTFLFLLTYGVIVGSFYGGMQFVISPAKVITGLFLSALICLPSLYIFSCLGQVKIGFVNIMGNLLISLTLISILLIGFAPVSWVFSQSTTSVPFIGFVHLTIYGISVVFAFRVLDKALNTVSEKKNSFISVWMTVFVLVSLQMGTTLRPIIGYSDKLLPEEKKFFLTHWFEILGDESEEK